MKNKEKIVFIHGLNNKPRKEIFYNWILNSIDIGTKHHFNHQIKNLQNKLEIIYWANLLYKEPLNENITDIKDKLYIDTPFIDTTKLNYIDKKKDFTQKPLFKLIEKLTFDEDFIKNNHIITNLLLKILFRDLDIYYNKEIELNENQTNIKELFQCDLKETLLRNRDKKIVLIAHSMGSIIAFDVINQLKDVDIYKFITIGSPLGLPLVTLEMSKSLNINSNNRIPIPQNINKWINIYDKHDIIATNHNLNQYYEKSGKPNFIKNIETKNRYSINNIPDHHAAYGYLQTEEVSKAIIDIYSLKEKFSNIIQSLTRS